MIINFNTVEPLLRGHPDERPTTLERPLDNVNLNKNVLISTVMRSNPFLKATFLVQMGWPHKTGSNVVQILLYPEYLSSFLPVPQVADNLV